MSRPAWLHVDKGVLVFCMALAVFLAPPLVAGWLLVVVGVGNALTFLFLLALQSSHANQDDAPAWATQALAPMRGILLFNLALAVGGLVALWHFYPSWGGA